MRYVFVLIGLQILFSQCCYKPVNEKPIEIRYLLLLENEHVQNDILQEYHSFGLKKILRSSRSQNQFVADFSIIPSKVEKLEVNLQEDPRILESKRQFNIPNKTTNSSNRE
jgi:hypothetical protein